MISGGRPAVLELPLEATHDVLRRPVKQLRGHSIDVSGFLHMPLDFSPSSPSRPHLRQQGGNLGVGVGGCLGGVQIAFACPWVEKVLREEGWRVLCGFRRAIASEPLQDRGGEGRFSRQAAWQAGRQ